MKLGAHIFVARGPSHAVREAAARGCEVVQIFSSNPRGWRLSHHPTATDEAFRAALEDQGIAPPFLHAPYLVNIAAHDPDIYAKSVACLVHAAGRARVLGGPVVVHAGRDQVRPRDTTLERAAAALLTVLQLVPGVRILVEPTSGGRGSVASTVAELAEFLAVIDDERVGVCLDTCHAHAAGHDLSTRTGAKRWLGAVANAIGAERVDAFHLNDARDAAGSCRDRHWHIGEGTIGDEGFRAILTDRRFRHAVGICETPGTADDDRRNLAKARGLAAVSRPRG